MPKQAGPMQLTERDRSVLYDLYHFRFLTTSLIVERRFESLTRGRARLRALYHHGFVDRTMLPSGGVLAGEVIYSLGPAAVAELATCHGLDPREIRRRRKRVEPLFIAHELLVARFRIRLAAAGAPVGVGIYDWADSAAARITFEGRDQDGTLRTERLTPDGIGWVSSRKARFAFCLEADRGTMTVGRVAAKFDRYREIGARRLLEPKLGASRFRVLVVAPSAARLASLKGAAEAAGLHSVWLVTEGDLERDLLLEHVWARAGSDERFALLKHDQIFDPAQRPGGTSWHLPPERS